MSDHEDHEPIRGLPDHLPPGEHVIWQGEPSWRQLALQVFHARKVAIYFALLAAIHVGIKVSDGAALTSAAIGAAWLLLLGVGTAALLTAFAHFYAKTTVYTITNRRIVMRFGVAVPLVVNVPWDRIDNIDLKRGDGDNHGDLVFRLAKDRKMSYMLMWPHVRPWSFSPVQPAWRCVTDVEQATHHIQSVLGASAGQSSATPQREPLAPVAPGATVPGRTVAAA